jgi:hypothetical protein
VLFLVKNSLVRWKRETERCRDSTISSYVVRVRDEALARFLCEQLLMSKKRDEHALDFALYLSLFLGGGVAVSLDFPCMARTFFPERLSSHYQGLLCTFSKIWTKFDAVSFVGSAPKSHQTSYTTPNKRT